MKSTCVECTKIAAAICNRRKRKEQPEVTRQRDKESRIKRKSYYKSYNKQWIKDNPEYFSQYRKLNKGLINAKTARRRAQKRLACPFWADRDILKKFYVDCPKGKVVDHIVPLHNNLVCGLHVINNLQYLTPKQNSIKGHKFEPTFISS
jgi:hypothetical protein